MVFWFLIGAFVLVASEFFAPPVREFFRGSLLFLLPPLIFSLLGGVLIWETLKKRITGKRKTFLLLTGGGAAGFLVSIVLHNLVGGLLGVEEPFFFLLAIIVCPLNFLVGAVGSILMMKR